MIIGLYIGGKTQREIAKQFCCSPTVICRILKKHSIKTRRFGGNLKYKDINTNFFKEINCEENAYFLGLLYADGCVSTKNKSYLISLKLKKSDAHIIERFKNIMSPSSLVKTTKDGKYCYFNINQKEICEQLINLGCVPNKSLILEFPTKVPINLIHHFLRGYSDGDGSIYKNKLKNCINTIWKITSTKNFCLKVTQILKNKLNINTSQSLAKPKTNEVTTNLTVGGNRQTKILLDWLYQDANIHLTRKYNRYVEFYQSCQKLNQHQK